MPEISQKVASWHRFAIRQIGDLRNAVMGADLEAMQMAGPAIRGSLAFRIHNRVVLSSGSFIGPMMLRGALSDDSVTVFLGLKFGRGSRHWLSPVCDGEIGIVLPGDVYDGYYTGETAYVTACMSPQQLEAEASRMGLTIDAGKVLQTGMHSDPLSKESLARLNARFTRIHAGSLDGKRADEGASGAVLCAMLHHYARTQKRTDGRMTLVGHARIVERAREFVRENLDAKLSLGTLAASANTSQRTLARAFLEVLGESPGSYVRRVRLHRIRIEIASEAEARSTISMIAARSGMHDPGRMAGWYRDLFGEAPSRTLATVAAERRKSFL